MPGREVREPAARALPGRRTLRIFAGKDRKDLVHRVGEVPAAHERIRLEGVVGVDLHESGARHRDDPLRRPAAARVGDHRRALPRRALDERIEPRADQRRQLRARDRRRSLDAAELGGHPLERGARSQALDALRDRLGRLESGGARQRPRGLFVLRHRFEDVRLDHEVPGVGRVELDRLLDVLQRFGQARVAQFHDRQFPIEERTLW